MYSQAVSDTEPVEQQNASHSTYSSCFLGFLRGEPSTLLFVTKGSSPAAAVNNMKCFSNETFNCKRREAKVNKNSMGTFSEYLTRISMTLSRTLLTVLDGRRSVA